MVVVTAGAGTGKTTSIRMLVDEFALKYSRESMAYLVFNTAAAAQAERAPSVTVKLASLVDHKPSAVEVDKFAVAANPGAVKLNATWRRSWSARRRGINALVVTRTGTSSPFGQLCLK